MILTGIQGYRWIVQREVKRAVRPALDFYFAIPLEYSKNIYIYKNSNSKNWCFACILAYSTYMDSLRK